MVKSTVSRILTLLLLLSSCTEGVILHQFCTVGGNNNGWERTDTLTYEIPVIMETYDYDMHVQLRVGTRFPYRTVCIVRELELSNPRTLTRDTLRIDMSDNTDRLDASGVTLFSIDREVMPVHLKKGQTGKLRLFHCMRQESLPMIREIGIRLRKP